MVVVSTNLSWSPTWMVFAPFDVDSNSHVMGRYRVASVVTLREATPISGPLHTLHLSFGFQQSVAHESSNKQRAMLKVQPGSLRHHSTDGRKLGLLSTWKHHLHYGKGSHPSIESISSLASDRTSPGPRVVIVQDTKTYALEIHKTNSSGIVRPGITWRVKLPPRSILALVFRDRITVLVSL